MKNFTKTLTILACAIITNSSFAQISTEFHVGIAPTTNTYNSASPIHTTNFGVQVLKGFNETPINIGLGLDFNISQTQADMVSVPLRANYLFGSCGQGFVGAGISYNYLISSFTNIDQSEKFHALFQTGYLFPLNQVLSLTTTAKYNYGLSTTKLYENNERRTSYLSLAVGLRIGHKKTNSQE